MNKIQKDRLLKLYKWMKQPQEKLAHKVFNFSTFNRNEDGSDLPPNVCGTMGCMAGELPAIFPRYFKWVKYNVLDKETNSHGNFDDFFGLAKEESNHLFCPAWQTEKIDPHYKMNDRLSPSSTKEEVVENLRRFLAIKGILEVEILCT